MNETTVWEVVRVAPEEPSGYMGGWAKGYTREDAKEKLAFIRGHWPEKTFEVHKIVTTRTKLDW